MEGNEPAYISKATNHSVDAVSRYLQSFKRVVALTLEGKDKTSIAFLLSISKPLVTRYQELFERYKDEALHNRIQEMESFLKKIFLDKKDPVQVARETDHSPEAVAKYCVGFNKVKWCVENRMGKEEIRIVTGMKAHLIDEYLKIMEEHKAALPP